MSFDYLTWETQWQRLYSGYHIRLKVIYSYSDHRLLIAVLYSKNSPHVQKFQCATALRSSSATNSDSGTRVQSLQKLPVHLLLSIASDRLRQGLGLKLQGRNHFPLALGSRRRTQIPCSPPSPHFLSLQF